jgi:predicted CopG family antitoxin
MLDLFGKKKKEIDVLNKIIAKLSLLLIQKGMSPGKVQEVIEQTRKAEFPNEN